MARGSDQRSAAAQAYRRWYWTSRWRKKAKAQLSAEPLCRICKSQGRITAATVADHVEPHYGDPVKFWEGELQSLCDAAPWRCHSREKQREERGTVKPTIGLDGWPTN